MSGGSYEYLYKGLPDRPGGLEDMADRLDGLDWASAPASDTRRILALLDEADRLARHLASVWQIVEWWDSNDSGEDTARGIVAKYEPLEPE
jgi:hypothetical protein